jgi:hypothetical protein
MLMPLCLAVILLICSYIRLRSSVAAQGSASLVGVFKARGVNIAYTLTLLSTLLLSNAFEIFNCVEQGGGNYVLLIDPSITCYDRVWQRYIILDAFFILLYIVFPALTVLYLGFRYRKEPSQLRARLQVFCSPYKDGCELWEFFRIFCKLVFVLWRDMIVMDRATRTLILLLILGLEFHIENRVLPFRSKIANHASVR